MTYAQRESQIVSVVHVPESKAIVTRNEIRELIMTDTLSETLKSVLFKIYSDLPTKVE